MKNTKLMISILVTFMLLVPTMQITAEEGDPTIEGPTSCILGRMYTYTIIIQEPDDSFIIHWGDNYEYKPGPYEAGQPITVEHVWTETGLFNVKILSANSEGHISAFSEVLQVFVDETSNEDIENTAPKTPSQVEGPDLLETDEVGTYTTLSQDADDDNLIYVFDWGDGLGDIIGPLSPGQYAEASHSWENPGNYTIIVMAIDSSITQSQWSQDFYVEINGTESTNTAPLAPAQVQGEDMCVTGQTYRYNTSTTDPEGDDMYYIFFWGTNSNNVDVVGPYSSGELVSIEHTWSEEGIYDVVAYATDVNEAMSNASETSLVHVFYDEDFNTPPEAPVIAGEISCTVNETYTYNIVGRDNDEGAELYYEIHWGDGTADSIGPYESGQMVMVEHKWEEVGDYSIILIVTDQDGASTAALRPLHISVYEEGSTPNDPPTIPSKIYGPVSCIVGDTCEYRTVSYDSDGDDLNYTFYWGDGTTDTIICEQAQAVVLTHTWEHTGIYNVKATVNDGESPETDYSIPLTVHVYPEDTENSPPTQPYLHGQTMCTTGETYSYIAYSQDPDNDNITYIFNWGDGTSNTEGPVDSGTHVSVSHTWEDEGTFYVSVVARDSNDEESPLSQELVVSVITQEDDNEQPEKPTISGPTEDVPLGETVTYLISSIDPEGDDVRFEYSLYHDGIDVGTFTTLSHPSGSDNMIFVEWEHSGTNNMVVYAIDEHDQRSLGKTLYVDVVGSVPPSEPEIWCNYGHTALEDRSLKFSFSARDADKDNIRYYIDWGDGDTIISNWVIYGDEHIYLHHTYYTPSTYMIEVTAMDTNSMESETSEWFMSITKQKSKFDGNFPLLEWLYDINTALAELIYIFVSSIINPGL